MKKSADILSNITIVAPAVTDDSSKGYSATSVWVDTVAQKIYQAVSVGVGVADWKDITSAGGADTSLATDNQVITAGALRYVTVGTGGAKIAFYSLSDSLNRLYFRDSGNAERASAGLDVSKSYQIQTLNAYFKTNVLGHLFTTLDSSASTPAFRLENSSAVNLIEIKADGTTGIGTATPLSSSRLHLVGKGSTSGTTALLVQNSLGTDLLEVKDDGTILGNLPNIYGADGTLTGARTVNMSTNPLTFDGSAVGGGSLIFQGGSNTNKGLYLFGSTGTVGANYKAALVNIGGGTSAQLVLRTASGDSVVNTGAISYFNGGVNSLGVLNSTPSTAAYNFNVKQPNGGNGLRVYTANGQNEFHLHDNGGGSAVVRFLSSGICYFNTAGSVGVGLTAPTAKLHIKGAGSTSGTTALLVQNSLGTDLLEVKDDGTILGNLPNMYTADGTIGSSRVATLTDSLSFTWGSVNNYGLKFFEGVTEVGGIIRSGGANNIALTLGTGANATVLRNGDSGFSSVIGGALILNGTLNHTPPTANYNIRFNQPNGGHGVRFYTANGQNEFHLHNNGVATPVIRFLSGSGFGASYINTGGGFAIGRTTATAKLHVQGSGSTSGTTALLVQNSLGTDLLEVKDDGRTTIDGAVTINRTTGNSALTLNGASNSNNQLYFTKSGAAKWYLRPNYAAAGSDEFLILNGSEAQQLRLNQTGEISLGGFAPVTNERLRIKGFGVGTNIALAVTNNANVVNFQVLDNGSVGIGGAPSGEKLYVKGVIKSADTVNTNGVQLDGTATSNNNLLFSQSGTPTWYVGTDNLGSDEFKWRDAGFTTRMALTQGGDLGVGISAPTAKLHVVGSTLLDGNLGVFGTTPIAQPTTGVIAPAPVAVGGVNVQTNDTFEGYTMSQVVKALRNIGVLA